MIGLLKSGAPQTTKARASVERLRRPSNTIKAFRYARTSAFVKLKSLRLFHRPDFAPIERSFCVRMRTEPVLRCHGGTSRNTAGALHRIDPGFRPLESWHELRDNPDGLVSIKASSPRFVRVRALAAPAISKMYLGYTLLKNASPARVLQGLSGEGRITRKAELCLPYKWGAAQ